MMLRETHTTTYSIDARVSQKDVTRVLLRYAKKLTALGYDTPEWATLPNGSRVTLFLTGVPSVVSHVVACVDGLQDDTGAYRTIIRAFPGKGDVDVSAFRDQHPRCDHCHQNRYRVQTFIVREPDTDELLMVGSTCVDDYSDREGTLALWRAIADLNAAMVEYENWGDGEAGDDMGFGGGGGGWALSVRDYTAAACCAIRHYGWHKSDSESPTKFDAHAIYLNRKDTPTPSQRDADEAEASIEWAKGLAEQAAKSDNDYLYNLLVIAGQSQVGDRFMGILASLPFAYQRHLARIAEREEEARGRNPEPLAPAKTRVRDIPVTIMDTRVFDGSFGSTLMVKMRDEAGRTLTWFSSSWPEVTVGRKAILTGTVKGYNESRQETQMTRCTLTEEA